MPGKILSIGTGKPARGASQFCKSALIPQPLLLRTVSDLRASYVLRTASNGPLPKMGEGEAGVKVPLPALGEGFRVRAAKLGNALTSQDRANSALMAT